MNLNRTEHFSRVFPSKMMPLGFLVFLFCLVIPSLPAEAMQVPRSAATEQSLYLQGVRDAQLPALYQMSSTIPSSGTVLHPRAYWVTHSYQNATFLAGTWRLNVKVDVKTTPSINVYTLNVLSNDGTMVMREIGLISRRYNTPGMQIDTVTFSSPSVTFAHERLEVYDMTPNWCTAAAIILGGNTYLTPPLQTVRASQRV